jgi:hypothetical protein
LYATELGIPAGDLHLLTILVIWAVQAREGCYEGFDESAGRPELVVGIPKQ